MRGFGETKNPGYFLPVIIIFSHTDSNAPIAPITYLISVYYISMLLKKNKIANSYYFKIYWSFNTVPYVLLNTYVTAVRILY